MNEIEVDLEEIYRFAIELGKSAGKILVGGIEKRRVNAGDPAQEEVEKLNAVDIVTQTDTGMLEPEGPELRWNHERLIQSRRRGFRLLGHQEQIPRALVRWRGNVLERLLEGVSGQG